MLFRIYPDYAHHLGCVLTGLTPDVSAVGTGAAARIFGQALVSPLAGASWHRLSRRWRSAPPAPDRRGPGGGYPTAPGEFRDWAAGTGQALAEFTTQLTRAKIARSRRQERHLPLGPVSR